jgi:ubiquinone/menaquinone biosynthesis C-methylase UbiE
MDQSSKNLQNSYNQVAEEYTTRLFHELEHKPLDQELLDDFAYAMRGAELVVDVGCGPGHVTRYLHERGVTIRGLDLSSCMVERACQLTPEIEFKRGDMSALPVQDHSWSGCVAFYSLIHFPPAQLVSVLRELHRVLKPGGLLFLAFHQGHEVRHIEEWWGKQVTLDFFFFEREEMEDYLHQAGFVIERGIERAPYEGVEVATQRAYLFARASSQKGL